MKKVILGLVLALIPSMALAQPVYTRNEAGTTRLTADGQIANTTAVDRALRQIVSLASGSSGPLSIIPISNATGLNGIGAVGIGASFIVNDLTEAGSTTTVINATAHVARVGDILSFRSGPAANIGVWSTVSAVTVNSITISNALPATPTIGDSFHILRPQPLSVNVNSGGSVFNSLNVAVSSDSQTSNSTGLLKPEDATAASGDAGVASLYLAESAIIQQVSGTTDYGVPKIDLGGRVVVTNAPAGEMWSSCSAQITTTASTQVRAAVASNRLYVTNFSCSNSSATASNFAIQDGATIIWRGAFPALASGGSYVINFTTPLRGTVNTALKVVLGSAGTDTFCCASGYISTI